MAKGDDRLFGAPAQPIMTCKKCGEEKPASAFYASNQSSCRECVKAAVRNNRSAKRDYYQSYDRLRYREQPHRKELARKSSASIPMAERVEKQRERRAVAGKLQYAARNLVSNGLRDGKIKKADNCFFCGTSGKLHAHHHDYSRPLDVFWLCPSCHGKLHVINGDFLHRNKPAKDAAK